MNLSVIGFGLTLAGYVLATVSFCLRIIFDNKSFSINGLRATLAAFVLHAVVLGWHFSQQGYPFLRTNFETLQLTSGGIICMFLVLSIFYRFIMTGSILVPLALVFYVLSLTRLAQHQIPEHFLGNPWAFIHLVFIFLSMSIFFVGFVTGFLYLLQESRIKNKKVGGWMERFPSLEILERIHYRALYIGFIFFTVGMITGAGWSKSVTGAYVTQNVKQLVSIGAWIFFAIFLNLRVAHGWVGRKGILLSGIGFVAVIFLFTWVQR